MKKSIFAVLAVTAMGASHAQTADTSSVSLYGVIDEGYLSKQENSDTPIPKKNEKGEIIKDKYTNQLKNVNESKTGFSSGNTSASYIGIRTKENLGNGLDARATVEFGYDAHGETLVAPIRQAHVGLYSKDYGSLTIGRMHNKAYDFLASQGIGSGVLPGTVFYKRAQGIDHINGIRYSVGNEIVTGYISYGQNNEKTITTDNDGKSTTITPKAYHQTELALETQYKGAFGKVAYIRGDGIGELTTIGKNANRTILATAGYDFGIIKPSYTFLQNEIAGEYHNTRYIKQTFHQVGFTAPVTGTINLYGSYYLKDASGQGSGDLGALSTKDGKGWQVGTTYNFSKRTNLYAAYGQESISYKYENVVKDGKIDNKAYTIGLKHTF